MNVDSSQTQNWLGFSLSSHHHMNMSIPSSDTSQLCFFEAFNSTTAPVSVVDRAQEEDATAGNTVTDLSIFTRTGPKLEDFLDIGGQVDMKLIYGIIAAEGKARAEKEDKSSYYEDSDLLFFVFFLSMACTRRMITGHGCTNFIIVPTVYLGGYDKEEKAARAYDLAALKYWGPTTTTNFPISNYQKELEEMKHMTRQEFVASLRRKSSGFSRGASVYRGVTRHHQHGRWQARIGRVAGNKDLYLGTFSTQEEAAEAYDIAAIKFRGLNAVTNFDMSRYDVKSIANSNLPIGGISNKSKNSLDSASDSKSIDGCRSADDRDLSSASSVTFASQPPATSALSFALPIKQDPSDYWSNILGCQRGTSTSSSLNSIGKSTNSNVAQSVLFQSSTNFPSTTAFSMDFNNGSSTVNESNNNGLLFSGGYLQQQSGGVSGGGGGGISTNSSSSVPFATPVALNISGSSYEGNSSYGSWIAQSLHSFQSAKPNLSMFQTPIFGME
ncbi:hypothetical protein GH714_002727 [Hevea brasiliensis]|uniref:AP2/ERF domain-containing protein n=1 Tax=Hevea brasiliensis TaxID=3981 RepID=A0A6A6M9C8_HEVBR|nr:hypothetical protein GH714_002727 [Hevea brasiliensis]